MLDLKEVLLTQEPIDVDAQGMSSQFRVQTGAQAPEGVSMVGLHVELFGQLSIHRLDNLPNSIDAFSYSHRQLPVLIGSRYSHQAYRVALLKSFSHRLANVPLVSHSVQVGVFLQQLISSLQIGDVSWDKFKIEYYPSQGDEQLHFVTEKCLLLGRYAAKDSAIDGPISRSLRGQVELHNRYGQTVNTALPVSSHIEHSEHHLPHQVEAIHQSSSPSVEATLRGLVGEQCTIVAPFGQEGQFRIPPFALTNQAHSHQFLVRAARNRARAREQVADLSVGIFHDAIHPQAEIVKVGYH